MPIKCTCERVTDYRVSLTVGHAHTTTKGDDLGRGGDGGVRGWFILMPTPTPTLDEASAGVWLASGGNTHTYTHRDRERGN